MRKTTTNFRARIAFTTLFLAALFFNTARNGNKRADILSSDRCILDQTFVYTQPLNQYFLENLVARDWAIIFNSLWIDVTICGLLFLFKADKMPSMAFAIALLTSSLTKAFTQENLLTLNRLEGFNYFFPGLYSAAVPYHDVLDFYFSGHMATTAVIIYFLNGLKRRYPHVGILWWLTWLWQTFKVAYVLIYMTALRTHYFIDFASGFCFGILASIFAEKLCYYFDVQLCGRPANKRGLLFYDPCAKCGWSNEPASKFIDRQEAKAQSLVDCDLSPSSDPSLNELIRKAETKSE